MLYEQYLAEPSESHSCIFELNLPKEYLQVLEDSRVSINKLGWAFEVMPEESQFVKVRILRTPLKLKFGFGKQEFLEVLDHLRQYG